MKKTFAFLFMLILIATFQAYAQSGSYNINPATKQVTNLDVRYEFSYFYKYDADLNISGRLNRSNTIVVIEIGADGTGRMVVYASGNKAIHSLITCYKYDKYFVFNLVNKYGEKLITKLSLKNNTVDQFWYELEDNTATVFCN